jgi:3-hydroxybutyryl-CoA dehydrogenase
MTLTPLAEQTAIAVLGSGRMGHAIAYVAAAAGYRVRVYDINQAALVELPGHLAAIAQLFAEDHSAINRIESTSDLATAVQDVGLVIEAAPEKLPLKQELFAQLDQLTTPTAILASNTSAIPIAQIAAPVRDKSRVVGAHFWNPPHLVRLVEVVQMATENEPAVLQTMAMLKAMGWEPVHVKRDVPGFVGNRLQHALKREAIAMVAAGICDAETIDTVVKMGFGARLGVLGPLEQSDMVGLELTKNIHDVLLADLDNSATTQPYLLNLVATGQLGMKTGQGFRKWTPEQAEAVRQRLNQTLVAQARQRRTRSTT